MAASLAMEVGCSASVLIWRMMLTANLGVAWGSLGRVRGFLVQGSLHKDALLLRLVGGKTCGTPLCNRLGVIRFVLTAAAPNLLTATVPLPKKRLLLSPEAATAPRHQTGRHCRNERWVAGPPETKLRHQLDIMLACFSHSVADKSSHLPRSLTGLSECNPKPLSPVFPGP